MNFIRLGILAASISLSSCSLSTVPEPSEFKLSDEALGSKFHAVRKTGSVRLYAQKIESTRDEWGRETHAASGGAVLVKGTMPPIHAIAPSITITPEYSEAFGKATVKKNDLLYIGVDESSKIRIEGSVVTPEGPHIIRAISTDEVDPPTHMERAGAVATGLALLPTFGADETQAKPASKPAKEEPKTPPKRKAPASPAPKPAPEVVKTSTPPPAPKPKPEPVVDRSKLLNLMREPTTDRRPQ